MRDAAAPSRDPGARVDRVLEANRRYAPERVRLGDPEPSLQMAVVTCMDARIDVFAVLGLRLGEVHVIRNAGARVTDDVVRSLAVSTHILGVDTVVLMQHTTCGLAGIGDDELRARTGADLRFHAIDDHEAALRRDIASLAERPYLERVLLISGCLYDLDTGAVRELARWDRPGVQASG